MTGAGRILVGVVGAAHGIKGQVRVKAFTGRPTALGDYGPLMTDGARPLSVETLRALKDDMLVVRFEGVADRTAAEALRDTQLFIGRDRLPPPEEGEFYQADLIGLAADLPDGTRIGRVTAVENYGAGDLLELVPPHGERVLVPFTTAFVPLVDVAGGRIVVTPEALVPAGDASGPTRP